MTDSNREKNKVDDYLEQFKTDWEADQVNRERLRDDLEFIAGEQWDEADKSAREAEGRPCLTVNRLPQFVRQVVGDLRNLRPSIKVRPNGNGADEDVAEVFNGIIRNIEERSKDGQPYTNAVENAVRCGIGHFRLVTENLPENPFRQDIFIRPIHNPLAVTWAADARAITRDDAKRCFVRESVSKKAFEKEFPDARVLDFGDTDTGDATWYWTSLEQVIISEVYEVTEAKAPFVMLEDGSVLRLDRLPQSVRWDEVNRVMTYLDGSQLFAEDIQEAPIRKVIWKKISGAEVLDEGEWLTPDIPVIPVIGEEVHFEKTKLRSGLIRWAKDPQRLYNFWRSTQTEIMGAAPKAPYLIGASQVAGFEKVWAQANKGNKPFLPYDDKKNPSRPTREPPPGASTGMNNEIALAAEDMKATTGIYDAALGARSNETAGVAIRQRQQEGDVSTNFFGDNLQASMRRAGRILVDLIPVVYDTAHIARIVKEDETDESVPVNQVVVENGIPQIYNDLTVGNYDVTVDIGPSHTTRRQEAVENMTALLQGNPQLTAMFLDIIAKRSDWPGAEEFVERAQKLLPENLQNEEEELTPEQQAQKQQAMQMQEMQTKMAMAQQAGQIDEQNAKNEKTRAETEAVDLENAVKKLELSITTGELRGVIDEIVRQAILGPPTDEQQAIQNSPAPSGVF